jgi:hypothetical protein
VETQRWFNCGSYRDQRMIVPVYPQRPRRVAQVRADGCREQQTGREMRRRFVGDRGASVAQFETLTLERVPTDGTGAGCGEQQETHQSCSAEDHR